MPPAREHQLRDRRLRAALGRSERCCAPFPGVSRRFQMGRVVGYETCPTETSRLKDDSRGARSRTVWSSQLCPARAASTMPRVVGLGFKQSQPEPAPPRVFDGPCLSIFDFADSQLDDLQPDDSQRAELQSEPPPAAAAPPQVEVTATVANLASSGSAASPTPPAPSGVTPNSAADNEAAAALLEAALGSTAPNSTSTSCGAGIPSEERIIPQQAVPAGLVRPDSHSFSTASTLLTLATSPRATPPPVGLGRDQATALCFACTGMPDHALMQSVAALLSLPVALPLQPCVHILPTALFPS